MEQAKGPSRAFRPTGFGLTAGKPAVGRWKTDTTGAQGDFGTMKFSALAFDYDGTIAVDGVFDLAVRDAIGEARRHGIVVILVTGRRLPDLHSVAGDLTCFDVIVAENGAVLEFPASGRHVVIGHVPSPAFLRELQRRGVPFAAGESVVEADGQWAGPILEVIRSLEQPLILAFNRGRLMVLPQAVAKSTGLRQALLALRTSIHNTIGIGDAENDHDLLDACEVGVAVGWGSGALRAVADEVIPGTGPSAVADFIRRVSKQPRLSAGQMGRRRLILGHQHNGDEVSLAVRGRTILIAGEPGTGKSWLAGLLCEQSDPSRILPVHHRPRRGLPIARSAAERDHARRRRSATTRTGTAARAPPPGCQRHRRSLENLAPRET
jgi:hydroxymethylpyrimidine pyrophosphatase-like HAD family hydrolase